MKCPKCKRKAKASATKFIEYSHAQRRIRTCECGFKFTTYERIEADKQDFGQHSKQKKKDFYKNDTKQIEGNNTTNNNLFVGSTTDLQRMLKNVSDNDNVIDINERKPSDDENS